MFEYYKISAGWGLLPTIPQADSARDIGVSGWCVEALAHPNQWRKSQYWESTHDSGRRTSEFSLSLDRSASVPCGSLALGCDASGCCSTVARTRAAARASCRLAHSRRSRFASSRRKVILYRIKDIGRKSCRPFPRWTNQTRPLTSNIHFGPLAAKKRVVDNPDVTSWMVARCISGAANDCYAQQKSAENCESAGTYECSLVLERTHRLTNRPLHLYSDLRGRRGWSPLCTGAKAW